MGFSRQEYWSRLPCPPLGDLPDPGIKPTSLESPVLAGRILHHCASCVWGEGFLIDKLEIELVVQEQTNSCT